MIEAMRTRTSSDFIADLIARVREAPRVLLTAPPGSGKTTRVPPALLSSLTGRITVTQPRRIAARMAATYVATQLNVPLGSTVGYRVRFEHQVSSRTRLEYCTEGVLLADMLADPKLTGIAAVVLDEIHERSLEGDTLLALLMRAQAGPRPDLKLVVMSATADVDRLREFLSPVQELHSEDRSHPVAIRYRPLQRNRPWERELAAATAEALAADDGDVLVFLPGAAEIATAAKACTATAARHNTDVLPLHGGLSASDQDRAVAPGTRRKLILSTNVAETSLTIDGVTTVIDTGLVRRADHDPWTGLGSLTLGPTSQAEAAQRAGRAGRTRAGTAVRLYSLHEQATRVPFAPPQIERADLAELRLALAVAGIDATTLTWPTPPPEAAWNAASALLQTLGALNSAGSPTPLGHRMAELPVHPRLARVICAAADAGLAAHGAWLAALLAEERLDLWHDARATIAGPSDALALWDRVATAAAANFDTTVARRNGLDPRILAEVRRVAAQIATKLGHSESFPSTNTTQETALCRALLAGFIDRVAARSRSDHETWLLCGGGSLRQVPHSVVRDAELAVVLRAHVRRDGTRTQTWARMLSSIKADWLLDVASDRIQADEELVWNAAQGRVEAVDRLRYEQLTLTESRRRPEPAQAGSAAAILAEQAMRLGLESFITAKQLQHLAARLEFAARAAPELAAVHWDQDTQRRVLAQACSGLCSLAELRAVDLWSRLWAALGEDVIATLERLAPRELKLPSGRRLAVNYQLGQTPWVESYLQDFFGLSETPTLADGRVKPVLHLWAPNRRAVQVTQDLAGFWDHHYPTVRKELMRRYPRHTWPQDPRRAAPQRTKQR